MSFVIAQNTNTGYQEVPKVDEKGCTFNKGSITFNDKVNVNGSIVFNNCQIQGEEILLAALKTSENQVTELELLVKHYEKILLE